MKKIFKNKQWLLVGGVAACLSSLNAMNLKVDDDDFLIKSSKNIQVSDNLLGLKMGKEALEEACKFEGEFTTAFQEYQKNKEATLKMSVGENIIVTIGTTGSGKSTLLNLLTDQKLKATDKGYILEDENSPARFKIGTGQNSETFLPKMIVANNLVLTDLPGFGDTRGLGKAVVNALFIKDIITNAKSVRFLFVEGEGAITDGRAQGFKASLRVMKELLPDFKTLTNASMLIITRSSKNFQKPLINSLMEKLGEENYEKGNTIEDLLSKMEIKYKSKLEEGFKETSASILPVLHNLFSLNENESKIFPFEDCKRFIENDEDGGFSIDTAKAEKSLKYTKNAIDKNLDTLQAVNIPEINPLSLLDPGMDVQVTQLFRILQSKHFAELFEEENKLNDFNDEGLNKLKVNIALKKEALQDSFMKKPEVDFIQTFNTFNKAFPNASSVFEDVEFRVKQLLKKIDDTLASRQEAERKKLEKERQERENFKKTPDYIKRFDEIEKLFKEMNAKKKAWQEYDSSFAWYDIPAFGISYVVKSSTKKDRKSAYYETKEELQNVLKEYRDHLLIQEKHPRHDEVF